MIRRSQSICKWDEKLLVSCKSSLGQDWNSGVTMTICLFSMSSSFWFFTPRCKIWQLVAAAVVPELWSKLFGFLRWVVCGHDLACSMTKRFQWVSMFAACRSKLGSGRSDSVIILKSWWRPWESSLVSSLVEPYFYLLHLRLMVCNFSPGVGWCNWPSRNMYSTRRNWSKH